MTPTLMLDLVAAAFATEAIVDIWFNGSIFAEARAAVQQWPAFEPPSRARIVAAELLGCPLCLNAQAAIWTAILVIASHAVPANLGIAMRLPVYAFAVAGVAWLLNERRPGGGYSRGVKPH